MQITIFSFLSALLWSSLLIVAIYLLRHTRFKQHFGVLSMVLLYLFCAVRLFLPLEFPHTLIAEDDVVYPYIYNLLTRERDYAGKQTAYTRPLHRMDTRILCPAVPVCSDSIVKQYAVWSVMPNQWDEQTNALLKQVQQQTRRIIKVQGYTAASVESAFGIGVIHKRIILPDKDYTEAELHYVLLHEYTHFLNHDTIVKQLVTLFCIIFWWNPVVYLLQKDLEQNLEIKCDLSVARTLCSKERAAYLRTILALMKQSDRKHRIPFAAAALFKPDADAAIKERFETVMAYSANRRNRAASAVFTSVFTVLLIASYMVLPQPQFAAPKSTEPQAIDFNSDIAYIKQDHVGEYWLCIQNEQPIKVKKEEADFYQQTGLEVVKE